jgi:hypothetical protein
MTRPTVSGSGAGSFPAARHPVTGTTLAARLRLHELLRDTADRNLDVSDRETVILTPRHGGHRPRRP